jgi:hypothetical protein
MRELRLYIFDIVQVSLKAEASLIFIDVEENKDKNVYKIRVSDNGKGLGIEMSDKHAGASLTKFAGRNAQPVSLFRQEVEQMGGSLTIRSENNKGTGVEFILEHSHVNRPILGDIASTISQLAASNPGIDFVYNHSTEVDTFHFDTREVKFVLNDVPISNPGVMKYVRDLIKENLIQIKASE